MGYPRQESWIEQHANQFEQTLLMGVGGSIEVFSGTKKRAPKLFRKLNLEWVYRLLTWVPHPNKYIIWIKCFNLLYHLII